MCKPKSMGRRSSLAGVPSRDFQPESAISRQFPFPPAASSEAARKVMRGNRRRDTQPEMRLRRALHARGHRYRVDYPPLPGVRRRADLVFTRRRVAVFVDGCYWHGCPTHGTQPRSNAEYWRAKIARNVERDRETDRLLASAGWRVVRVWEHDPVERAVERVEAALLEARFDAG